MKKKGFAAFLRRKQYVIAGAIVVVAAVGTTVLYSNSQESERKQLEAELAEENSQMEPENTVAEENTAAAEDSEETAKASSVIPPADTKGTETKSTETAEAAENAGDEEKAEAARENPVENEKKNTETGVRSKTLHFLPENGILWPMEGNVILNYSMDATVYFPTLDQYKYNPAVVIEGDVNDKVYSVAKGKVASIENSEVTGCTMTVDLGDGYQAIYGQLKEPNFEVGDYVESGHVLGYVAEPTKYFSVEGSSLYFALQKDGQPMDPVEFFE